MMKKCLVLIITLFLINPFIINALTKEEMQQMALNEVLKIDVPSEMNGGFQGFTITKDYFVAASVNSDGTKATLVAIDILTKEVVKQVEHTDLGHANDMTYNEETNEISILNGNNIIIVDGDSLETKKTLSVGNYSAIAMDNQKYYFWGGKKGYIYSSGDELVMEKEFDVPTNLVTQGIAYNDNYLYFSAYEQGSIGKYEPYYDGILERGANIIYVYDLSGTLKNTFYIPTGYGEIESLAFINNNYYMLFNNNGMGIIYTPIKESVSETFQIKTDVSFNIPFASLSSIDGTIETVSFKNGEFTFSPIVYEEEGEYSYVISKSYTNKKVLPMKLADEAEDDVIEIDVDVLYSQNNNSLSSTVKYKDEKETFETPMVILADENEPEEDVDEETNNEEEETNESEEHYCTVIDGVYYNSLGEITDIEGYNKTCRYVENPKTGIILPTIVLLSSGIVALLLIFYKKNIIIKLK